MANLIFGANLGSEILYNGVPYILKETGKYTRNEFNTIPMNINTISNIERPTYSVNHEGIVSDYEYPLGAEAAAYKYGWKAKGIVDENPIFKDGIWISPQPLKCKPVKVHQEFANHSTNNKVGRYSVSEWNIEYFTAPCDGVLRVWGGANFSLSSNPTLSTIGNQISIPARSSMKSDEVSLAGLISPAKVHDSDTIEIAAYGWINDNIPVEVNPNRGFCINFKRSTTSKYDSNISLNENVYRYRHQFLIPVQMKEGDTFCYHTNYLYIKVNTIVSYTLPEDLDFSTWENEEGKEYQPWYWFNGIFYPNKI